VESQRIPSLFDPCVDEDPASPSAVGGTGCVCRRAWSDPEFGLPVVGEHFRTRGGATDRWTFRTYAPLDLRPDDVFASVIIDRTSGLFWIRTAAGTLSLLPESVSRGYPGDAEGPQTADGCAERGEVGLAGGRQGLQVGRLRPQPHDRRWTAVAQFQGCFALRRSWSRVRPNTTTPSPVPRVPHHRPSRTTGSTTGGPVSPAAGSAASCGFVWPLLIGSPVRSRRAGRPLWAAVPRAALRSGGR